MNRRDALRRLILSLLVIVFGPKLLELVDGAEFEALVRRVERSPVVLQDFEQVMKLVWGSQLEPLLYPRAPGPFERFVREHCPRTTDFAP